MLPDRSLRFLRPFLACQNLGLGGVPTDEAWWTRVFTAGPFPIDPPAVLLAPGSGWTFPSSEQIVGAGAVGARAGILGWWLVAPGCCFGTFHSVCLLFRGLDSDWGLFPLLILKRLTTTISAWILSLDHHPPLLWVMSVSSNWKTWGWAGLECKRSISLSLLEPCTIPDLTLIHLPLCGVTGIWGEMWWSQRAVPIIKGGNDDAQMKNQNKIQYFLLNEVLLKHMEWLDLKECFLSVEYFFWCQQLVHFFAFSKSFNLRVRLNLSKDICAWTGGGGGCWSGFNEMTTGRVGVSDTAIDELWSGKP